MRADFIEALADLAERDERVVLLTGDLGFTVLESFAERFPKRFFNMGVAEQNMIGVATGLAESGFRPFVYSIATFATLRGYEFIRNGPVLHRLPVRIVGVGGGFDYGHNGATHYALEDVGALRLMPDLRVIVPADADQARAAVAATADWPDPLYFRIGREGSPVPGLDGWFDLEHLVEIESGTDLALLVMGPLAHEARRAAELLRDRGVRATVAVVSSLNPIAEEDVADLLDGLPVAVTMESHYRVGGLGTAVAEVVADRRIDCRLVRCGVENIPRGETGSPEFLNDLHGISAERVAERAMAALGLVS